jgi:hypothetical protein
VLAEVWKVLVDIDEGIELIKKLFKNNKCKRISDWKTAVTENIFKGKGDPPYQLLKLII